MPPRELRVLVNNLKRLAHGEHKHNLMKKLRGGHFRLCESPVGNWRGSGRFIWQIAVVQLRHR